MAINSLSSASKGMSGLASGMDTQSMVDAMLAGTQAKIDKQKANKTILGYKQNIYRDIQSTLKAFQDSFLKFSSNSTTNLLSSSFYNTMNAVTKSTAFKVSGTGNAAAGKTVVNAINQLAKSSTLTSTRNVSGTVKGKLALDNLKEGSEFQLELDGVIKTIKLPQNPQGGKLTEQQFVDQLDANIQAAFGNGVSVKLAGDEIVFEPGDNSRQFKVLGNLDAMNVLGVTTGASNKINTRMKLSELNFATPLSGSSFKFSINNVDFSFSSDDTLESIIQKVNSSSANVKIRYSTLDDRFVAESTVSGAGAKIDMEQTDGNLLTALFGAKGGNTVAGNQVFGFSSTMVGTISGYSYSGSGAMSADDKTKVDSALAALEKELTRIQAAGGSFKMVVDGKTVDLKLTPKEDPNDPDKKLPLTLDDLEAAINGNTELQTAGVSLTMETDDNGDRTGKFTLTGPEGKEIVLSSELTSVLGFKSQTNVVKADENMTLEQLGLTDASGMPVVPTITVGGTAITGLTKDSTMKDVAAAIQAALPAGATVAFGGEGNQARFRIMGVDIPMKIEIGGDEGKLFGTDTLEFSQAATYKFVSGQNAELIIDGKTVIRNSNDFTIDGLTYQLTDTFNQGLTEADITNGTASDAQKANYATIETTRDTQKIYDGISKFMEEYNKVVDKVWGLLKEEPVYRDYAPLTDKQKEAMSDKEIELWEKKSQEGLMRGDQTLVAIMDTLRRSLLQKPEGAKYSLADLGISTGYDLNKGYGGMLTFGTDGTGGDKLKELIAQEPGEIERLFANSTNGIMTELNQVMDAVQKQTPTSGSYNGKYASLSLADLAGRPGLPDTASTIYKQLRDINTNLEGLERKYKLEYKRYWNQFNSMEKMIANMNSQSSWLAQQFAG